MISRRINRRLNQPLSRGHSAPGFGTPPPTRGPELVSNGTFTTDTTGWSPINATLSSVGGRMRVTKTAAFGQARATITTAIGTLYEAFCTFSATTVPDSTAINFRVGTTSGGLELGEATYTVPDTKSLQFTATTTTTHLNVVSNGTSGYDEWDNISVRAVL